MLTNKLITEHISSFLELWNVEGHVLDYCHYFNFLEKGKADANASFWVFLSGTIALCIVVIVQNVLC